MFKRKKAETKQKSERHFICSAVEELLRAELEKVYTRKVFLFNSFVVAERVMLKTFEAGIHTTETDVERDYHYNEGSLERYVRIKALVGPTRAFTLERVEAVCRLYSVNKGKGYWPHFLSITMRNESGSTTTTLLYASGYMEGGRHRKHAEDPCREMFIAQTAIHFGEPLRESASV